jgi:hypothetical protein
MLRTKAPGRLCRDFENHHCSASLCRISACRRMRSRGAPRSVSSHSSMKNVRSVPCCTTSNGTRSTTTRNSASAGQRFTAKTHPIEPTTVATLFARNPLDTAIVAEKPVKTAIYSEGRALHLSAKTSFTFVASTTYTIPCTSSCSYLFNNIQGTTLRKPHKNAPAVPAPDAGKKKPHHM